MIRVVTDKELESEGIAALEDESFPDSLTIIAVSDVPRYVVLSMEDYRALRKYDRNTKSSQTRHDFIGAGTLPDSAGPSGPVGPENSP